MAKKGKERKRKGSTKSEKLEDKRRLFGIIIIV